MTDSPPSPEDDEELARSFAAASPADPLGDDLSRTQFLRKHGLPFTPVTVGIYEVERRIGRGGFGTVYSAVEPGLDRRVAIKFLHPHRHHADPARLGREAKTLARLKHPGAVVVHSVGESSYGTFIAMEYVDGSSLRDWQRGRPIREIVEAYVQAGDVLAAAHSVDILHLDFKPANALVQADGRVKVLDFGLGGGPGIDRAVTLPSSTSFAGASTSADGLPQTRAGGGTPGYASPEQATGALVDPRSDQFSFCAALYEAVFGSLPFDHEGIVAMARASVSAPSEPRGTGGPRWLRRALVRGLAASPADRWPSMQPLLAILRQPPWYRRNHTFALLGACGVALPMALANFAQRAEVCKRPGEALEGIWDTARRDEIDAAILRSGVPYGEELSHTLVRGLDRYADGWLDASVQTCEAQEIERSIAPEEYVRRRDCLRRARHQLGHATSILAQGDLAVIERADELLSDLVDPTTCDTPLTSASTPVPTAEAAELLEAIDRARLDLTAGRIADAREGADRAATLALQLDAPVVLAEAKLVRGMVLDEIGRDGEAAAELREAGALAVEAGRDGLVAESWRRLARLTGHDLYQLERAQEWARLGAAAARRAGGSARVLADQLDVEGELARLGGKLEAAEAAHRAAITHLERDLPPDDPRWIESWLRLAQVRAELHDLEAAHSFWDHALELARARRGRAHPQVAKILLSRGLIERGLGEVAASDADFTEALAIATTAHGAHAPALAPYLTAAADVALMLDRVEEAAVYAEQAWAIQRENLPEGHIERGGALEVLAEVELHRRHWAVALELHEQLAKERGGSDADERLRIDIGRAWLLCRLGRCTEARPLLERAGAEADDLLRSYVECGLGHVELAAGRPELARLHLERALEIAQSLAPPPADVIAESEWLLGKTLFRLGRPEETYRPRIDRARAWFHSPGNEALAPDDLDKLLPNEVARSTPVVSR